MRFWLKCKIVMLPMWKLGTCLRRLEKSKYRCMHCYTPSIYKLEIWCNRFASGWDDLTHPSLVMCWKTANWPKIIRSTSLSFTTSPTSRNIRMAQTEITFQNNQLPKGRPLLTPGVIHYLPDDVCRKPSARAPSEAPGVFCLSSEGPVWAGWSPYCPWPSLSASFCLFFTADVFR